MLSSESLPPPLPPPKRGKHRILCKIGGACLALYLVVALYEALRPKYFQSTATIPESRIRGGPSHPEKPEALLAGVAAELNLADRLGISEEEAMVSLRKAVAFSRGEAGAVTITATFMHRAQCTEVLTLLIQRLVDPTSEIGALATPLMRLERAAARKKQADTRLAALPAEAPRSERESAETESAAAQQAYEEADGTYQKSSVNSHPVPTPLRNVVKGVAVSEPELAPLSRNLRRLSKLSARIFGAPGLILLAAGLLLWPKRAPSQGPPTDTGNGRKSGKQGEGPATTQSENRGKNTNPW